MTEPTLDYLRTLQDGGATLTDFEASKINTDIYRVIVHCADGSSSEFRIQSEHARFMEHFREAVAFTGFGSRGLGNLIYADARAKANELGIPPAQVQIFLSEQCFQRVQSHLSQWTHYGFTFHVRPSFSDFSYTIKIVSAHD